MTASELVKPQSTVSEVRCPGISSQCRSHRWTAGTWATLQSAQLNLTEATGARETEIVASSVDFMASPVDDANPFIETSSGAAN